jgi:hypothetical protein
MTPAKSSLSGLSLAQIEAAAETRVHRAMKDNLEREHAGPPEHDHKSPILMDVPPSVQVGRDPDTGRFTEGWSGRPRGSLNKATIIARNLLEDQAETFARSLIALALAGDTQALRVCSTRLLPARRDLPVDIELPAIVTAHDAMIAAGKVTEMIAQARLTPSEGQKLANIIEVQRRAIETADLERRILQLEGRDA